MKRIRRVILWLIRMWNWRKRRGMAERAERLNVELTRIEYRVTSARAREAAVRRLADRYPPAAVAAIADVRGFKNLARIARKVTRELREEAAA